MTTRTKVALAGISAAGAIGLWFGYTKAAFFLPGWTLQRARALPKEAA